MRAFLLEKYPAMYCQADRDVECTGHATYIKLLVGYKKVLQNEPEWKGISK